METIQRDTLSPCILSNINCQLLSTNDIAEIKALLFKNKVLVLRNQTLTPSAYKQFLCRLGSPVPHILDQFKLPEDKDILIISNLYDHNDQPIGVHSGGTYWHADMSYSKNPHVFTALYSIKQPTEGSFTRFIDCVEGLRRLRMLSDIQQKQITHYFINRANLSDSSAPQQHLTEEQSKQFSQAVEHPLIMTHPSTGAKSLYAVGGTALKVKGMSNKSSIKYLDELLSSLLQEAPTYTHRYQTGDLVIWDNLSVLHSGVPIKRSYEKNNCRLLYRINLQYLDT